MLHAATAALVLELVLASWWLARRQSLNGYRGLIDRAVIAEHHSDLIREAWNELAEQGASFRARLSSGAAKAADARAALLAVAARARVDAEATVANRSRTRKGVTTTPLTLAASGSEERVINFLIALDRVQALVSVDAVTLTGATHGRIALQLAMRHYEITSRAAEKLDAFVKELPRLPADAMQVTAYRRDDPLFLPAFAPEEAAIRGWPRILVTGFSGDEAVVIVGGEARTVSLGMSVTGEIVYAAKIPPNQAVLKRKRDNTEVIATVGSAGFSLRPSEFRSMNEFILTLQKRSTADLFSTP